MPEKDQAAPDPARDLRERERAAIASRVKGHEHLQTTDAGVDGAAPPPKPSISKTSSSADTAKSQDAKSADGSASPKAKTDSKDSDESTESDPSSSSEDTPSTSQAPATERAQRFTLKAFKKFAETHPEEAAQLMADLQVDVFKGSEEQKTDWVKYQHATRKRKQEFREMEKQREKEQATFRADIEKARQHVEGLAQGMRYLTEMWNAGNGKDANGQRVIDFDTVDEAFRQNTGGMTVDEYMRARARRGAANPELAKARAEARQLRQQLEARQTPQQTNGAGGGETAIAPKGNSTSPPPAPAAPKQDNEAFWGDDIPKTHGLRKFSGWGDALHEEMQRYYDDDSQTYSRDPGEIADRVLQRMLKAFEPEEDEQEEAPAPKPKAKPNKPRIKAKETEATDVPGMPNARSLAPRGSVNTDRSHKVGHTNHEGLMADRERVALDKARERLAKMQRGEAWE